MNFSNIKARIKNTGRTISEIADLANIHRTTLSRIINDKSSGNGKSLVSVEGVVSSLESQRPKPKPKPRRKAA